jgi:hypothetical protein
MIGRKNWTSRWFVLRDGFLYYYVRPPVHAMPDRNGSVAYNCKGIIPIARPNVEVVKSEHHTRKFCFEVRLETRTFIIDALSETNRDDWMTIIKSTIDKRIKVAPPSPLSHREIYHTTLAPCLPVTPMAAMKAVQPTGPLHFAVLSSNAFACASYTSFKPSRMTPIPRVSLFSPSLSLFHP